MTTLASKKALNIPFSQLDLADENLRNGDAADPMIPSLADSLINPEGKSIQLFPLFVKTAESGRYGILDGRRRWMAYAHLISEERIKENFQIRAVVCETEEEVAQAVILANTQRLAVSESDELLTINKLISDKFTVSDMARALGRTEKDVRQKLVLAKLDREILIAYKKGQFDYTTLRKFTRITDEEVIEDLKERLQAGHRLWQHEIRLPDQGMTANHPIFSVISVEEYCAAGGQIVRDLFEELPIQISQPDVATKLFEARLAPAMEAMQSLGVDTYAFGSPDHTTLASLPWNWRSGADPERLQALEAVVYGQDEAEDYDDAYEDEEGAYEAPEGEETPSEMSDEDRYAQLNATFIAQLNYLAAKVEPLHLKVIGISTRNGLELTPFVLREDLVAHQNAPRPADADDDTENPSHYHRPSPKTPPVDTKGFSNAQHERTTRMAGQALAVTLRTSPLHALGLQISTQLRKATRDLRDYYSCDGGVLTLQAKMAITGAANEDQDLSSGLLDDFKAWKERFVESGKTHFGFVMDLALPEQLDLLSVLTALQVDMSEIKTDYQKHSVRAEAVELAEALGHRFEDVMIPGPVYFKGFKKPALLSFVRDMGLDTKEYEVLKTGPLQETVAELAKEHRFAPRHLNPMIGLTPQEPPVADVGQANTGHQTEQEHPETDEVDASEAGNEIAA